jgi:flotillin
MIEIAIGAGYFLLTRYKISSANQYLVRTGLGIKDILISKNGIQWPFQRVAYVDLTPKSYNLVVHAMSNEKMEFILPTVFTIGPKDDLENLRIFAKFLLNQDEDSITDIIKGVIEGETRVLAANMSIEEIFKGETLDFSFYLSFACFSIFLFKY